MSQKGNLVDDVRFVGGSVRSYQFYVQDGEITVDDYTKVSVGKVGNGSDVWEMQKTGTHQEPNWVEYELGTEKDVGTYQVRLDGEKKDSRTVGWQIKTEGKWLNEWAVRREGALLTNVTAYYQLDETAGVVVDETGINDGVNIGATR